MELSQAISKSMGAGINMHSRHDGLIVFAVSPDLFCTHNSRYLGTHLAKHWVFSLLWPPQFVCCFLSFVNWFGTFCFTCTERFWTLPFPGAPPIMTSIANGVCCNGNERRSKFPKYVSGFDIHMQPLIAQRQTLSDGTLRYLARRCTIFSYFPSSYGVAWIYHLHVMKPGS